MCATTSNLFDYFELWLISNSWNDVDKGLFVSQLEQIGSVEKIEINHPVAESILRIHEVLVIPDPILPASNERTARECREFVQRLCRIKNIED